MSVVRAVVSGERVGFEYFVLRCVPRVDRGESVNVGIVLHSQMADFLGAKTILDVDRLRMLDADVDIENVRAALATMEAVCEGAPDVGPAASGTRRERFGWLSAPRSTMLQPGPVHGGLTDDPAGELERLVQSLIATGQR
jgi:Protein of unknown function (DUF3037)